MICTHEEQSSEVMVFDRVNFTYKIHLQMVTVSLNDRCKYMAVVCLNVFQYIRSDIWPTNVTQKRERHNCFHMVLIWWRKVSGQKLQGF